ncbi:hypothetical protein ACLBX9_05325 [Methylobacterium sp. A49B]
MIYTVRITRDGKSFFSRDIVLDEKAQFDQQIAEVMHDFRLGFPNVSLLDPAIRVMIYAKD